MDKELAIVLVHGINSAQSGAGNIDKIGAPLIELIPHAHLHQFDYGYKGVFKAWRDNKQLAVRLASTLNVLLLEYKQVVFIGHSNGCAIGHQATAILSNTLRFQDESVQQLMPRRLTYIYIAPALKRGEVPAFQSVANALVMYSEHDKALKLAHKLDRVFRFFHYSPKSLPWGELGRLGPLEDSNDYDGIDFSDRFYGHSDYFNYTPLPRSIAIQNVEHTAMVVKSYLREKGVILT